jgi:hypothetical protein
MKTEASSSNVRAQGLPCDTETPWASSGKRGPRAITASLLAPPRTDCPTRFRGFRAFRGDQDHTLSNHSVQANRRPAAPLEAGSQFGSRSSARPAVPAAVAHLGRSLHSEPHIQ